MSKVIEPGQVWTSKKGDVREVVRITKMAATADISVGSIELGQSGYIFWAKRNKDGELGSERRCWMGTWQGWAVGATVEGAETKGGE